jgi:hypothetical protein
MEIKPIETEYGGYKFRSRLEARWAVFFDTLGIKWEYEPEGYEFEDGTKYLADFFLPESNQFFEAKGVMTEADMHKIKMMTMCDKDVVVGYNDFTFQACSDYLKELEKEECGFYLDFKDNSELDYCPECKRYFFLGNAGSWSCRCCNTYLGDDRELLAFGDMDDEFFKIDDRVLKALKTAKQARFEHGEKP